MPCVSNSYSKYYTFRYDFTRTYASWCSRGHFLCPTRMLPGADSMRCSTSMTYLYQYGFIFARVNTWRMFECLFFSRSPWPFGVNETACHPVSRKTIYVRSNICTVYPIRYALSFAVDCFLLYYGPPGICIHIIVSTHIPKPDLIGAMIDPEK